MGAKVGVVVGTGLIGVMGAGGNQGCCNTGGCGICTLIGGPPAHDEETSVSSSIRILNVFIPFPFFVFFR